MKFYHKYQKALEAKGYRVDEHGYVWDGRGNQAAGEDNYGNVQSKDPNVTDICRIAEAEMSKAPAKKATPPAKTKKATTSEETLEIVRARDADGHFVADDPSTPDVNEAWAVKTVKKAAKKK
jgi:hypothetical protein